MSQKIPNPYRLWAVMIPLLLLATALIAHHLTTDVYWFDELANLRKMGIAPYPSVSFGDMIINIGQTRWVPAYNFVLLGWGNLVGWATFATRTLSLFMGVISVALIYQLGRKVHSQQAGFASAILLGSSVYFVFYAHEMRGYIQYMMLTILSLYLYWKYLHQTTLSRRNQLAFVITLITLMYSHYVALFVAFSIGLYHLLFARQSKNWGTLLRLLIIAGIAYLPWIPIAVINTVGETLKARGQLSLITIFDALLSSYSNGLSLLLIALLLVTLIKIRTRATGILWFCMGIILVLSLALNVAIDFIGNIRQIIGLLPIVMTLAGVAIATLSKPSQGLIWLIIPIWIGAGILTNRNLTFMENLPGMLKNLSAQTMETTVDIANTCIAPDDTLITHFTQSQHIWNPPVQEYYLWQTDYKHTLIDYMLDFSKGVDNAQDRGSLEDNTHQLLSQANTAWVFVSPIAYDTPAIKPVETILIQTYAYCAPIVDQPQVRGYIYSNTPDITCQSELVTLPANMTSCDPNLLTGNTSEN